MSTFWTQGSWVLCLRHSCCSELHRRLLCKSHRVLVVVRARRETPRPWPWRSLSRPQVRLEILCTSWFLVRHPTDLCALRWNQLWLCLSGARRLSECYRQHDVVARSAPVGFELHQGVEALSFPCGRPGQRDPALLSKQREAL